MNILMTLVSVLSIVMIFFFALSFLGISDEVCVSGNLKNKLIEVGTNYGDTYLLNQNYIIFRKRYSIFNEDNTKIVDGNIVISPENVYEYEDPTPTENIDYNSVKTTHIRKKVNAKIIISSYPIEDDNYPIVNDNPEDCSIADDNYSTGEIYKKDKFIKKDCFVYYKPSENKDLEFCVSSTSKIPLFFVIRNCLFIQKGMNVSNSISVLYDNGLRVFDDIKFINFNVEYF